VDAPRVVDGVLLEDGGRPAPAALDPAPPSRGA